MSELIIMRHGKSDWSTNHDDFHRPLKKRGKTAARLAGQWLTHNQLIPDYVISSSAVRARSTAKICMTEMGLHKERLIESSSLYMASVKEMVKGLLSCQLIAKNRVLLVGHNPGLDELVEYLNIDHTHCDPDGKLMSTAALAIFILDPPNLLKESSAKLVRRIRPDQMAQELCD